MANYATAGTQLKLDISGTYTNVPNVLTLTASGADKTSVDVTPISSTATVEIGATTTYGQFDMELAWDPDDTVHQALYTAATTANTTSNIKIQLPSGPTNDVITCTGGYFKFGGWSFDNQGAIKISFTYVISASTAPAIAST